MTGYPWSAGDQLFANDLNAAFANLGASGSLPLSGGTMTGPFTSANGGVMQPMTVTDIYQNPNSWALGNGTLTIRADPYGYYDAGTLLSVVATGLPLSSSRAGINGGWEAGVSAIAGYGLLDEVNIYSGVLSHEPPLVLHNVTYDATHVYPAIPLTAAQIAKLRVNMYVMTNSIDTTVSSTPSVANGIKPEIHYASLVTGWAANGSSITVVGWTVPGSGHTAAGQVPSATLDPGAANATAYFGAPTNVFGANFMAQHQPTSFPDSRIKSYQGIEFDFQNWDTTDYTMKVQGLSLNYDPIYGAKATADSYGLVLSGFPTAIITGYTPFALNTAALNIYNNNSPVTWAGSPVTNLTWEAINFIDSNALRLQCWTSRDTSAGGWTSASVRLGLRIDGTVGSLSGSPMAQLIWNPANYLGGFQIQTNTGAAGLTIDSNANIFGNSLFAEHPVTGTVGGIVASLQLGNPNPMGFYYDGTLLHFGTCDYSANWDVDSMTLSNTGNLKVIGTLTLAADPTSALQAATKQYVDAHAGSGGGMTSITAGTGLTGGTITTSGTIALANTSVAAASYTNASITVNAQGQLTAASSGSAPPGPATVAPLMDTTTAAVGTSLLYARQDHQHSTDTSRYAASNPSGYISGNQTITLSGDAAGSGTTTITTTLATVNGNVGTFQGLTVNAKGLVTAATNQSYAPLASPTFSGTPSLPTGTAGITQTAGNSTTALATTAFVQTALPVAATVAPLMNSTAAVGTSLLYARQDHVHASDTSRLALTGGTMSGGLIAPNVGAQDAGWGGSVFSTYTGAGSSMGFYNGGGTLNFGTCDAAGNWTATYMSLSTTTGLNLTGAVSMPLSAAKTGTAYTVAATDYSLNLGPTGTFTLTLPAASSSAGRILNLKLTTAFAVNSASANVVPLAGGSASTAIMTATAGKYCELQSDGTNWQIMMGN